MTIETKYNWKDEVWTMYNNKPTKCYIRSINIYIRDNGVLDFLYFPYLSDGNYCVNNYGVKENVLFKTKEELIASL